MNLLKNNLRRRGKNRWKNCQQKQISDAVNKSGLGKDAVQIARAAFPGSMLFNQILIHSNDDNECHPVPLCTADSVECVYEYCSFVHTDNPFLDTVIIDGGDDGGYIDPGAIAAIISTMKSIKQVVFLGQSTNRILLRSLANHISDKVNITMLEPDWSSGYELHQLYRQAEHVLFVDTMRVLDAAYTGCSCSLLVSEKFNEDIAFDLLVQQLNLVRCPVFDHAGEKLETSEIKNQQPFLLVENRKSDLLNALSKKAQNNYERDWLVELTHGDEQAVISDTATGFGGVLIDLYDHKIRIKRKSSKLREDPLAFLLDSDHRALRSLGSFLKNRKVA